jgi:hypothetical protein
MHDEGCGISGSRSIGSDGAIWLHESLLFSSLYRSFILLASAIRLQQTKSEKDKIGKKRQKGKFQISEGRLPYANAILFVLWV